MARSFRKINVYLEVGQKRTFAGALDWPGWCRSGRDKASALQALFEYGPRYASILHAAQLDFQAPADVSTFVVVERLKGDATTDFGAPAIAPSQDAGRVNQNDLQHFETLLRTYWQTLDAAVESARGKPLKKGPRGGGRELKAMLQHLLGSDAGYLNQVGWKFRQDEAGSPDQQIEQTRHAIISALRASARGEIPPKGPRGGIRWTARYFVRRIAWHTLDHAWEIEDRISQVAL